MSPPGYPSAWLRPRSARFRFARQDHCSSAAPCCSQLPVCPLYVQVAWIVAVPVCFNSARGYLVPGAFITLAVLLTTLSISARSQTVPVPLNELPSYSRTALLVLGSYVRILGILLFVSGLVLPFVVGLVAIIVPSARVVMAVLESSHARFSVFLYQLRYAWPVALVASLILFAKLGANGASEAIFGLHKSEASTISDAIVIALFYLWMMFGSLSSAGLDVLTTGLEKVDGAVLSGRILQMQMLWAPIVLGVCWRLPGPYGSVGILSVMFLVFANTRYALRQIARIRRARAPQASDQTHEMDLDRLLALQVSDVHATTGGSRRTDGGPDGTASLEALSKAILRLKSPGFILLTGDIIDRGAKDEWVGVIPLMHKLREVGWRILITPGNHDVATAYDPGIAEYFGSRATQKLRLVDGRKLLRILECTAEMEPSIQTWDGPLLSEFTQNARQPVEELAKAWRAAREEALTVLRADPAVDRFLMRLLEKQGPHHVFGNLWISSPQTARSILDRIVDHAARVVRPAELGPMTADEREAAKWPFRHCPDWDLPLRLVSSHWAKLWFKPFPLRLFVPREQLEFLVLNSNAPEPGLLGSAFGYLGSGQLERLRTAVSNTSSRTLVVLMHHPVCGWTSEVGDQPDSFRVSAERWAMLAHDSVEGRELTQVLETMAPGTCRQVFLCGGHRHGIAHAGPVQLDTGSSSSRRLWVMESAALPDLFKPRRNITANNGLLALSRSEAGELKVGRIPWASINKACSLATTA